MKQNLLHWDWLNDSSSTTIISKSYFANEKATWLLFIILSIAKFASTPNRGDHSSTAVLLFGLIYSGALALSNSELLLRLYPVAMSLTFSALFAISLSKEESLIEQFAKLSGKTISVNAKRYTRKLTGVWALLLLINALIALYLSLFATLESWALYCGLLSYLIFAAVFGIELLYRRHYIRTYGE